MQALATSSLASLLLAAGALAAPTVLDPAPDSPGPVAATAQDKDIVDTANSAGIFKTLLTAAKKADLVDALRGKGPLTVLAPTDDAFKALGDETIQNLLRPENKDLLARILTYHVVSGRVTAADALKAGKAATLAGPEVTFSLAGGQLLVNGEVKVTGNDVLASNGVIHIIDQVLIPPAEKPQGRLVIGFFSDPPGQELARYLGVKRNECLLISEVTKGSEAEAAGLRAYDLIVGIDGKPATSQSIQEAKDAAGFGGTIHLDILRRGAKVSIDTKVGIEDH